MTQGPDDFYPRRATFCAATPGRPRARREARAGQGSGAEVAPEWEGTWGGVQVAGGRQPAAGRPWGRGRDPEAALAGSCWSTNDGFLVPVGPPPSRTHTHRELSPPARYGGWSRD